MMAINSIPTRDDFFIKRPGVKVNDGFPDSSAFLQSAPGNCNVYRLTAGLHCILMGEKMITTVKNVEGFAACLRTMFRSTMLPLNMDPSQHSDEKLQRLLQEWKV